MHVDGNELAPGMDATMVQHEQIQDTLCMHLLSLDLVTAHLARATLQTLFFLFLRHSWRPLTRCGSTNTSFLIAHNKANMKGIPSQAFRVQTSSKVVSIPTRHDTTSGQFVVRWKDILQFIKNADGIMEGEDAVLFLTDDNLEDLLPLRIAYRPGIVLEIVTQDDSEDDSSSRGSCSEALTHQQGLSLGDGEPEEQSQPPPVEGCSDGPSTTAHEGTVEITDKDGNLAPIVRSPPIQSTPVVKTNQPSQEDTNAALQEHLQFLMEQTERMQQQMDEVQQKLQQADKENARLNTLHNNKKSTLSLKALVVIVFIGLFAFNPYAWRQFRQRHVVEQSTQQHFLQHLGVLIQKIPKPDQKTLVSLQEQIDVVLQKTKLLDQEARAAQIQHEQHTEDLLQRIDHLEMEIREMRAGDHKVQLSQQQLQKTMDWILDNLVRGKQKW